MGGGFDPWAHADTRPALAWGEEDGGAARSRPQELQGRYRGQYFE